MCCFFNSITPHFCHSCYLIYTCINSKTVQIMCVPVVYTAIRLSQIHTTSLKQSLEFEVQRFGSLSSILSFSFLVIYCHLLASRGSVNQHATM